MPAEAPKRTRGLSTTTYTAKRCMPNPIQLPMEASAPGQAVREMLFVEAGVEALQEEMRRDPSVIYLGQGIGPRGGNYKQSKGLWEEFGDARVRDTPISELGQVGAGVGAAAAGLRPVIDLVFLDMIMEAVGQIVEQAATIHYTSNGKIRIPMVIRAAMGTVRSTGPHTPVASTPGLLTFQDSRSSCLRPLTT